MNKKAIIALSVSLGIAILCKVAIKKPKQSIQSGQRSIVKDEDYETWQFV